MRTPSLSSVPLGGWAWGLGTVVVCAAAAAAATAGSGATAALTIVLVLLVTAVAVRGARTSNPSQLEASATTGPTYVLRSERRMWVPLWIALVWLLGTFAAFWLTGLSSRVPDAMLLTIFVLAATGLFSIGYAAKIKSLPQTALIHGDPWSHQKRDRTLIVWSAVYFAVFGAVQMSDYGAAGLGDILNRVQDPGSAYQAKFQVYELAVSTGQVSPVMQLVTLAGGLYGVLGPLLVLYWTRLTLAVRIAGVIGLLTYATFFLFIGTQKGVGDLIVMCLVGLMTSTLGTWHRRSPSGRRRRTGPYVTILVTAFVLYMVFAQAGRADQFDTRGAVPPNPTVVKLVGDRTAIGVATTLFYPTHGYLGLSYNLGSGFTWTHGLGASAVINSYAAQYLGTDPPRTYPVRTEERTGWPAGMYWATIYPWLASDLTFPGAALFMLLLGWWFAKTWVEGAMHRDTLSLVLFGQLAIMIAYVPANNQIGMSRPVAIGFATLLLLYLGRWIRRSAGRPPLAGSGRSR